MEKLFDSNKSWAAKQDLKGHAKGQSPKYLWIGCADSRIPAHEMMGLEIGDVFVHRNVANVVAHTDVNCLSVLEYGVVHLGVEHIIVCGHSCCGGVAAAMQPAQYGLVDNWIRHIRDVYEQEKEALEKLPTSEERYNRLIELNVIHQVRNVSHTTIVQNAWAQGKPLTVHGWLYDVATGLLKDLDCSRSSLKEVATPYHTLPSQ